MKKCIECKALEVVNGYTINREVDSKRDPETDALYGHKTVFYTVNDPDWMIESFKTLREAEKYAKSLPTGPIDATEKNIVN